MAGRRREQGVGVLTTATAPSWRDRFGDSRNRLLGNPAFHRFAARFPLTRWIARRRAGALFDLCAGFVYSQTLFACVELQLLDHLADGARDVATLSVLLAAPQQRLRRLLEAAASLGLLERRDGERYGLGPGGAALLGNPGALAMVRHHAMLYADLADPVALVRNAEPGRLSAYWPYATSPSPAQDQPAGAAAYSSLMAASQAMIADDILDAAPLSGRRSLMDVGGGEGAFLIAAARRAPRLGLTLFDLPSVMPGAEARIAAAGCSDRIRRVAGSFLHEALPAGADVISLVRVLHDHDDEAAMTLLRAARAALAAGGLVMIAEPMAGVRGAESVGAYFEMYLLAMGSGRPRRPEEISAMLRRAGFSRPERLRTNRPVLSSLVIAHV